MILIDRILEKRAVPFFPQFPVLTKEFPAVNFRPPVDKDLDLGEYPSHQVSPGIKIIEEIAPDVVTCQKINGLIRITAQRYPAELTLAFILVQVIITLKRVPFHGLKNPRQKQQFRDRGGQMHEFLIGKP